MTGRARRVSPNYKGWRALAAAVIIRAMKDYMQEGCFNHEPRARRINHRRQGAADFLQGDMSPFAEVIGLDPETDLAFRHWCRAHGLVAGSMA